MTVELSTTEQLALKRGVSEYKFAGVMSVNFAMGLAGMAFDAKLFSMKDGNLYTGKVQFLCSTTSLCSNRQDKIIQSQ